MVHAPRTLAGPLAPAALAGLLLVVVAAVALFLGRVAFAGDPAQFEDAILAVGIAVLVGAVLATALAPTRWVTPPTGPASPSDGPTAAPAPASAPALRAAPGPPAVTSIPASYVAAMYAPPGDDAPAPEYAGAIPASLPFAAFPRPAGARGDGPTPEGGLSLDVELARLRARIHELEVDHDLEAAPPWFAARSGGSRDLSPLAANPKGPVRPLAGGTARCIGCGTAVSAQALDPLCGNCGRPLCDACGGVPGPTIGLRRCPECAATAARTRGVAISGGRSPGEAPATGPPTRGGSRPTEPSTGPDG